MVRVRYSFGSRHTGRITNITKQRQKYPKIMKDVIKISDIVLEILDARYIEETRNVGIEEQVDALGKKLIFVFNKCDLVDRVELEKQIPDWMRPYEFISATKGIGLNELKGRIKMEAKRILLERKNVIAREKEEGTFEEEKIFEKKKHGAPGKKTRYEDKTAVVRRDENWGRIHVGVVGVPNAGKSSVINFITRRACAPTAAQAGFTKGMQKIKMSDGILILDTPGVISEDQYTTERKVAMLEDVKVGARSYNDVRDPERAVMFLLRAAPAKDSEDLTEKEEMAIVDAEKNAAAIDKFYGTKSEGDVEVLIEDLGRMKGFLAKGGVVDEDRTARLILRDWQTGAIRVK